MPLPGKSFGGGGAGARGGVSVSSLLMAGTSEAEKRGSTFINGCDFPGCRPMTNTASSAWSITHATSTRRKSLLRKVLRGPRLALIVGIKGHYAVPPPRRDNSRVEGRAGPAWRYLRKFVSPTAGPSPLSVMVPGCHCRATSTSAAAEAVRAFRSTTRFRRPKYCGLY